MHLQRWVNAICALPSDITELRLGTPLEELQGDKGQDYYYSVLVPPGKDKLVIDLERSDYQSDNDADLFVSFEENPLQLKRNVSPKPMKAKSNVASTTRKPVYT